MLIHVARDFLVLKTLALHDVAPVAARIADREKDQLALTFCLFQGLGPPRVPIDWVVGMLQEVRAGFLGQTIGSLRRLGRESGVCEVSDAGGECNRDQGEPEAIPHRVLPY